MTEAEVRCLACGLAIPVDALACPTCGSPDRSISARDSATGTESLRLKGRHTEAGVPKKPYLEVSSEVRWNHDRQQWERRRLVVDRDRKHYEQVWTDLQTGEETYGKRGPLDDPGMHGESARRPRRSPE